MNDGLDAATKSPAVVKRRRGLRWVVVLLLALASAAGTWLWMKGPSLDPRLIGEWRTEGGPVRMFHADGRCEHVWPSGSSVLLTGPRNWFIEKGELVISSQRSFEGRLTQIKRWFRNLFSSRTGVLYLGLSDSRFEIVELTDTTLRLRVIRPRPAPELPIEVLHRAPTKKD